MEEITRQVELDTELSEVILTGHSAGGAVSSLIFLHLICHNPVKCELMRFLCAACMAIQEDASNSRV
jgi:hypothetical protein